MKPKCTKMIIFFTMFFLGFMGCSSTPTVLTGRYVHNDETRYFDFTADGTYSYNNEITEYVTTGIYSIEGKKVIFDTSTIFYIVENYLCTVFDGSFPKNYDNTILSCEVSDGRVIMLLKEDMTFIRDVYSINDNQLLYSVTGTYTISQNKIICIEEETNYTYTFLERNGKVYYVEYIKQ